MLGIKGGLFVEQIEQEAYWDDNSSIMTGIRVIMLLTTAIILAVSVVMVLHTQQTSASGLTYDDLQESKPYLCLH
ncbi:lytic transglycosylase, catalytic [Paenibacillus curdlanolyticus YK9]|uniref:Lytic transglycosylase, catalytic n=1 Tax=Paenibacillus curdlanolyticus YK9 TaxID=717606 RepID=E0IGE5_9BACL|nr:lytic transglycosylase, catalytic [Paenibacillus curdlanolyticus YK9]